MDAVATKPLPDGSITIEAREGERVLGRAPLRNIRVVALPDGARYYADDIILHIDAGEGADVTISAVMDNPPLRVACETTFAPPVKRLGGHVMLHLRWDGGPVVDLRAE